MTSPLHGEGRRFESGRAHHLFFDSEAGIVSDDEDDMEKKLPTSEELPTSADGEETNKEATDEQERQKKPLERAIQVTSLVDYAAALIREERAAYLANIGRDKQAVSTSDAPKLRFSESDLNNFVAHRKTGLAAKSLDWIDRASLALWESTKGEISRRTVTTLRESVLAKYSSPDSHSKVLSFAAGFLRFLAKTKMEPRYTSFEVYLEMPRAVKERKSMTQRIVTKDDIKNVLGHIKQAENRGDISTERSAQYSAFVIFGAFTGQRSLATMAKLTVGQFREALQSEKHVLQVDTSQDKIRMSHYVPLHPQVVKAVQPLLEGRKNDERVFAYNSFVMWTKRQKILMSQFNGHFVLGDLRKFAEQHGDIIQWEQSNRAYILTHGVSGIEWGYYRHPLPDPVYDIYMNYWGKVRLS
jgi:hypothetical protein